MHRLEGSHHWRYGGFLGQYIAEMLVKRGDTVRNLSRGKYPQLEPLAD
ncbi:MAG: hypothetical protein U0894_18125 [Pirellulales bacterium]